MEKYYIVTPSSPIHKEYMDAACRSGGERRKICCTQRNQ